MKTMKKIVSLLLVLTMAVGLSLTAFAAEPKPLENGTLKVTGAQLQGKEVIAVRMFTANVDDRNNNKYIDENDLVSYEMDTAWQKFFNEQLAKQGTENATSEDAYKYVAALKDNPTNLVAFAKNAKTYYNAHSAEFAELTQKQTGDTSNTATFANLTTGYYLVLPANGSTKADRVTDAMIVNVPGALAAELQLKTEYPSVDKVIVVNGENKRGSSAQIGEDVNFQLTATVPNMTDYKTYTFKFKDTLSKGLTLKQDTIKVTINGEAVTKESDYTVSTNDGNDGETILTITFTDLKKVPGATPGAAIKVTYSATLNKDAQTGTVSNTNKAELEYSNDPTNGGTGTSEPSVTKTYTFDIKVHKYANEEKGTILSGAVFELRDTENAPINLVKENNDYTYHVATPAEIAVGETATVTQFTTVAAQDIVIKGLKEGTYKLHEVTPPTGYNKLTKDVTIVVAAQYDDDGTLKADFPKYTVNEGTPSSENIIEVQNKSGAYLPETGSIGTIGLTILGVLLVVGGLGFTSSKKKQQA